jgi:hypothetical protein
MLRKQRIVQGKIGFGPKNGPIDQGRQRFRRRQAEFWIEDEEDFGFGN